MTEENKNINNRENNNQKNNNYENNTIENIDELAKQEDTNQIIVYTDEKAEDDQEYNEETKKRLHEIEEIIKESNKPAETNILEHIKFRNKEDKFVFDRLPLSDWDKEQIINEIY